MAKRRILVSWVGYADLSGLARDKKGNAQAKVLEWIDPIGKKRLFGDGPGPIKTLLESERFDEIQLLLNFDPKTQDERLARAMTKEYVKWIGGTNKVNLVALNNPTDYHAVFQTSDRILKELMHGSGGHKTELCIHLSPGTPAMTAIWVLLGKSRYPATFYQTHKTRGAWVEKIPFDLALDYVPSLLRESDRNLQELAARSPREIKGFEDIAGESRAIRLAVGMAQKAAIRDVPVLILGESGTGKEMFARAIHEASHRMDGPFKTINCAAIPEGLLESELFGHKKGAFTGATQDKKGAFEEANMGTLFLDEIGECNAATQVKLLRVLQPPRGKEPSLRVFSRVGETKETKSNVRVIAATNRNLLEMVNANRFREDLYYRLAVIMLKIPALRERRADIPRLADVLLGDINRNFEALEPGYKHKSFSDSAIQLMKQRPWPGNVRELHNAILRAAVLTGNETIDRGDITPLIEMHSDRRLFVLDQPLGEGFQIDKHLESIQRHYLKRAMKEAEGRVTHAARLLGIANYQTLDGQLKRFGLENLKR